jgi:ABC-type branched-subunit amino acid transport system substrate-binding protein
MSKNDSGNRTRYVRRRKFLTAAGAAGALALAGCSSDPTGGDGGGGGGGGGGDGGGGETTTSGGTAGSGGGSADALKIGLYGPFSGPAADIGQQKQMAYKLAQKMVNEQGGVHGQPIEVAYGDSESKPASGRSAVSRLIQSENIDILGGGFHSDIGLATIEVTQQHDVPQIIDECVSSAIIDKIEKNDMKQAFKTAPPSEAYAVGWKQLIETFQSEELGYFPYENKKIALIGEDTSYGLTVMDMFKSQLSDIGWNVVSQDEVPLDETNFTPLLSRIKSNDPDVVWAIQTASSGAANLVKQFQQLNFGDTHFFHNYGLTIGAARKNAGQAANGAITLLNAGKVDKVLKERGALEAWDNEYDADMTGSAALAFQNVIVISEMVKSAESLDAFRDMSMGDWEQLVLDHEPITGGTGYIKYQDNHQAAWGSVDTQPAIGYQVVDQELNMIWPQEIASGEFDSSFYQ